MMQKMEHSKGGGNVKSENHADQREPSEYAAAKKSANISDTQTAELEKNLRTTVNLRFLNSPKPRNPPTSPTPKPNTGKNQYGSHSLQGEGSAKPWWK